MAVIKYARGEHPGGFIGYRVATTVGSDGDYRQRYYSLDRYGSKAKVLAYRQDRQWRAQAERLKSNRRVNNPTHQFTQRGITGITGMTIQNTYYMPKNGGRVSIYPKILIGYPDQDGVRRAKAYGIRANGGLEKAWLKACRFYKSVYTVRPRDYTRIRRSVPCIDDVVTYLLSRAREAGYVVRRSDIKLGLSYDL